MANTECDFIPGGQDLPLIDARSEDEFYADSPVAEDIIELLDAHTKSAIYDINSIVDKELLRENTKALNVFIYSEIERVNKDIGNLVSGNYKAARGSGFPRKLEKLYDINAVYDAETARNQKGLVVPAKKTNTPFENLFPFLSKRLRVRTGLTQAETQYFITTNLYDPKTFKAEYTEPANLRTLHALEDFYAYGNFSQTAIGTFCGLVPDVFAAVNQLKDGFDDVTGYLKDVRSFFDGGAFTGVDFKLTRGAVKQMVNQLKQQITNMVEQLVKTQLEKVKHFTGGFLDETGYHTDAIVAKVMKEKEKVEQFFSDDNIKNITQKIKGSINYAAGVFERMDLEEVQFLILRFCEFMTSLETLFYGRTAQLSNTVEQYRMAKDVLSGSGNVATARAIQAGAIRYNPTQVSDIRTTMSSMSPSGPISDNPNAPPGSAPATIRALPAKVGPMTQEEVSQIPSYQEIMNGNMYFHFPYGLGGMKEAGWTGLLMPEKIMLLRLAKLLGNRISINSAYRSASYNASVGGAKGSMHKSGKAIDCWKHGGVDQETFINKAREIGFTGIGRYNTFTHIDTGPTRSWRG